MSKSPEPLLPAGLHDVKLEAIREECVEEFSDGGQGNPDVRRHIMDRFEQYLSELAELNAELEVWVDGSFVTEKPKPNDVDVVIFADLDDLDNLSDEQQKKVRQLIQGDTRQRYETDAFLAPVGNSARRKYWRDMFGTDRQGNPKGIYRLVIN